MRTPWPRTVDEQGGHQVRSGRGARLIAALGLAPLLAAAVSVFGPPGFTPASLSSVAAAPLATSLASGPGCGHGTSSGSHTLSLDVDGHRRVVIVHIPPHYDGSRALGLVLNLHGSGGTARQEELFTAMDATADAEGFIVAYPQALIKSGRGFDWNIPNEPLFGGGYPPKGAADDVKFLTELAPDLAARYCIDLRRVYATGISGGGRMASQLACDSSGTFAAIAPVAGLRYPSPCPAAAPVPVIAFHGTADPIDPYNGHGEAYWTYSVPAAARLWAVHDKCGANPGTATGTGYRLTKYAACSGTAGVELYSLIGEGHEWPGGPKVSALIASLLGPQSDAVDANAVMWAFFEDHPLHASPASP
jgi:polyhydroxybutyrate depolymerase